MLELEPGVAGGEDAATTKHATRVEIALVCLITIVMIVLPVVEVALRKIRGSGVPGGSVYVQHLTLWLGFLGALLATGANKHLGLATAHLLKPGRARTVAFVFGAMVTTGTCALLTYAGAVYVNANRSGTATLQGGIPQWWSELIVPLSLGLITLRFIWRAPAGWIGRFSLLGAAIVVPAIFWLLGDGAQFMFWPFMICVVMAFLIGAPIFAAMSGAAMLLFFHRPDPIAAVPAETLRLVQNSTLPAIPLLTLAGYVLAAGGASQRLVRAYKSLFGWMPGGVALMVIGVCALFTTFTGGSGVTILALGGLVLPALLDDKYPEGFSLGLVTASGSLGLLFPPSLPVILYGAVAGIAPEKLFLGGLVPGVLLMIVVSLYAVRVGIVAKAPRQAFSTKEVTGALWAAKWDLGLPIVVLGTIISGVALIVEASALGAAYAIAVELLVFRDVHPTRELPKVIVQSATLVGAVVILMGAAFGLHGYLVDAQVPELLVEWVQTHFHHSWSFLLALNAILLVLGSVFEIYAAIIALAPLIAPLGAVFNVDPVHLGVVFLANLELGFLFPPMGLNLLLSASRFGKPLPYLYKQAIPFLLILALGVLFITYVPAITTGVVALVGR